MRNAPSARLVCAAALVGLALAGCGERSAAPGRARVAVTIPPLAWVVERLVDDPGQVVVLLPPGANPHSFEPGLAEVRAAAHAALLVEVGHPGLPFEQATAAAIAEDRPQIVRLAAASERDRARPDPHLWLSPTLLRAMAARIADGLFVADPANARAIAARAQLLDSELEQLDAEIIRRLAPFRGRAFASYHPDWTAFAEDYGLVQLTIERGHREPDAATLAARIEEARAAGVRLLVVQPQYPREAAELVAAEIGAQVVSIDPLALDWPGTLRAMTDALAESFVR